MDHVGIHNEKVLLQEISEGSELAFRELYNGYQRKVYFIACRLLKSESEAEDTVQEIFSKIWVNRHKLPDLVQFNSWLNTLVRNHLFNSLRKKANEATFLLESVNGARDTVEDFNNQTRSDELHELLHQAISALPPQQKRVFQLGRMEGFKYEEIASELNISRETVKKHMTEATRNVREFLERANGGGTLVFCLIVQLLTDRIC